MKSLRYVFTKWYVKQGYLFEYGWPDVDDCKYDVYMRCDGFLNYCWICPKWVRHLLIFFSPSVYMREFHGKNFAENFRKCMEEGIRWNKEHPVYQEMVDILKETEEIRISIGNDEIIYEGKLYEHD